MKRFISRKTIKVPRYKLIYVITFLSIFLIIGTNIIITLFLQNINTDQMLSTIVNNAYGFSLDKNNKSYRELFIKNIYGFDIKKDQNVLEDKTNFKDLIINKDNLGNPLIYIYNTFQTDKYKSNYYNSYNINSFVTQASKILGEYLKNNKINSVVETESVAKVLKENNTEYTFSYRGSRILLERAYQNNKSLKYFFDIQISNSKYNTTTTTINGVSYAKILFVVGTDNNNYQDNQKLALKLNQILETKEKDLSLGVSLRGGTGYHGVYNQDFSKNSLLIEVGGKENTIEEVNRSLKVLADVINLYLEENNEKE